MSMPDMAEQTIRKLVDGTLPNWYVTPDAVGIIYVGEWMLMGLEVSKGFQKLINHEDIGGFRLPPGVIVIADGNRVKDKSGGMLQSRAIMSRFKTYELEYSTDYALEVMKTYHERVAAFAIRNPSEIDNYEDVFENDERSENDITYQEGKVHGIWASLRSWDRVSREMRDSDATGVMLLPDETTRNVGTAMAAKFGAFNHMLDNLATLEDILRDPKKVAVPQRMDEQYALTTMLALLVNKDSWEAIATYCQRFTPELQTCYFQLMNDRLKKSKDGNESFIKSSVSYKKWITAPYINKILQGASS
jgi:hypothetical protein